MGRRRRTNSWRREWDSNPRYGCPHTRFPSVRLQPLGHPSRGKRKRRHYRGRPPERKRFAAHQDICHAAIQGARYKSDRRADMGLARKQPARTSLWLRSYDFWQALPSLLP